MNTKTAAQSIFNIVGNLLNPYGGSIFCRANNEVVASPIPLVPVMYEVEQWCKENENVICWFQYREDTMLLPDENVASIGVRKYEDGNLVYSMDGSMMRKVTVETEGTTVTGDHLYMACKENQGKFTVIDGTIDIDLREDKDMYYHI